MTASLLPWPRAKFFSPNTNLPLAGGKVYTYIAGTSTPLATYTDSSGGAPNANPVILDVNGEANIWLTDGLSYKIDLFDASNVHIPGYPIDNVINDDPYGSANQLRADLANTASNVLGAGLVGWSTLLTYPANTVGSQLKLVETEISQLSRAPTCGRLSNLITGTGPVPGQDPFDSCHFISWNGNRILINGMLENIPHGTLASSGGAQAKYSNCVVNKVPGQTLADNTFYYIYIYMLAGVMTINFSTTGYNPNDSTYGIAVKSDDPASTLIGICRIHYVGGVPTTYGGARGQTIASYYNRFPAYNLVTAVNGSAIVTTTPAQLPDGAILPNGQPTDNFIEWVQWSDQTPTPRFVAIYGNAVAGKANYLGMGYNSKTAVHRMPFIARSTTNAGTDGVIYGHAGNIDSDGYNYVQMIGYTEAGGGSSATFSGLMMLDNICV